MDGALTIDILNPPLVDADVHALAELLADAVASGAAVSFLAPFTVDASASWWRSWLASAPTNATVLVARDDTGIAGVVLLTPAWAPNQPDRAEISKLLVDQRARRRGVGMALMEAAEAEAERAGFTLLTLDAKGGGPAERLYRRRGWIEVGVIPDFALDPDGRTPHDAVIFYKRLGEPKIG